jgi:D-aminopeptidase
MRRARDRGLAGGQMVPGPLNAITDVPGVAVGHCTRLGGGLATGVTAVVPHGGDVFRDKVAAAVEVINGFGKSAGVMQVQELGTLETPVLLTNTFGVGACTTALIRQAVAANPGIGRSTSTVNPVVMECNDGPLNDIQAMAVTEADALAALAAATGGPVEQGAVGAGTGMTCFGFKGGIGSASRAVRLDGRAFHLGALVLTNFGRAGDLVLPGGLCPDPRVPAAPEQGSVIVVLATDVPLSVRQLGRVARRAGAGLARLGAFWGHGSGDVVLAFSTANRVPHDAKGDFRAETVLNDARIDLMFRAAAEATAEAVLDSMLLAGPVQGREGVTRPLLSDWLAAAGR